MLSFFQPYVLDEILNLIESVSEGFPSYSNTSLKQRVSIFRNIAMLSRIGLPSNAATPLTVGGWVVRRCLVNF